MENLKNEVDKLKVKVDKLENELARYTLDNVSPLMYEAMKNSIEPIKQDLFLKKQKSESLLINEN